jgi:F-type H+-transporting ATPase subunit a
MLASLVIAADPLGHVLDKTLLATPGGTPLLTMKMVTMVAGVGLLLLALRKAAGAIETGPESQGNERYITKGAFAQMVEVIVLYLRDTVIKPQLGEATNRFLPFLLTIFFFILVNNLLGLVPLMDLQHLLGGMLWGDPHFAVIGGTATGNIAVTGALALIAFIVIQVNGIRSSGIGGWARHFMGGAPWYIAPIMVPVEIMGTFIKPFALALRLFANMTAGHVLLAVLIGFTGLILKSPAIGVPVGVVSVAAAVAILFLELFVAFLQAFIFMFLTTLFIAQLSHHHHDEHGHEGGHAAAAHH